MKVASVEDSAEYAGCTGLMFPELCGPDAESDEGRGTGPLVAYKACVVVREVSEWVTSVLHVECVVVSVFALWELLVCTVLLSAVVLVLRLRLFCLVEARATVLMFEAVEVVTVVGVMCAHV